MTSHLEKCGLELLSLGYDVVPIPAGSKGCTLPGWSTAVADEQKIRAWCASFVGCGIRGPRTVGIDLDIRDEELTQHIRNFTCEKYGYTPYRIGLPPKALLPYRCEVPFSKIRSSEFHSPDGNHHMIEILAEGQQFVTAHIHPDTRTPYIWHYRDGTQAESLLISWVDLPLIGEADVHAVIAEFEAQCEKRGWVVTKRKKDRSIKRSNLPPPKKEYSDEVVREMLSCLNPDMEYEGWLKIGMALHSGGYSVDLWDEWSQGSDKYKLGTCHYKWSTFSRGRS